MRRFCQSAKLSKISIGTMTIILKGMWRLLQIIFVLAIAALLFQEISGESSVSALFQYQSISWEHKIFGVCALMSIIVLIGGCSVLQACFHISAESREFEKRRYDDVFNEDSQLRRHLNELKYTPNLALLESLLKSDKEHYSPLAHHSIRFAVILKSVCRENGKLPSLSDLRFLTYAAESARPSVWRLRVAISVLLIVGILGTLVGIHGAISSGIESGARAFPIEKLQPALLPSALAVLSTIILIILRGFYQRRVERYIGRLDRHTISCYFSVLRPPAKVSVQLREITGNVENFSTGLKNVLGSLSQIKNVPEQFSKQCEVVDAVRERINDIQVAMRADSEAPGQYEEIIHATGMNNNDMLSVQQKLLDGLLQVKQCMEKTTDILLSHQIAELQAGSAPFSVQANLFHKAVIGTPLFDESRQQAVNDYRNRTQDMHQPLTGIAASGEGIMQSLAACKNQAAICEQMSKAAVACCQTAKTDIVNNKEQYETYRTALNAMYQNALAKIKVKMNALGTSLHKLKEIDDALVQRAKDIENEKTVYWYEVVIALVLIVVFVWNICLTFA